MFSCFCVWGERGTGKVEMISELATDISLIMRVYYHVKTSSTGLNTESKVEGVLWVF